MLPNTLLASICHLCCLLFLFASSLPPEQEQCFCWLIRNGTIVTENYTSEKLYCQQYVEIEPPDDLRIPCIRYNNLVKIGPMPLELLSSATSNDANATIEIAPWGFANLFSTEQTNILQLDLHAENTELNALTLGGLDNVREFLGRNSFVRFDGCSFANMKNLKHMMLSCKAITHGYLTFGPGIEVVRFVDCEFTPLQFHCISCLQNPEISVIRISPGPPLGQYMIKFSQFSKIINQDIEALSNDVQRFSIGKCVPRFCSDEVLCRNNLPLQLARENVTSMQPTSEVPLHNEDSNNILQDTEQFTTSAFVSDQTLTITSSNQTLLSQKKLTLSYGQHVWIIVTIICLIVASAITLCVVIKIIRKGDWRMRDKRRTTNQQSQRLNGLSPAAVTKQDEANTELRDALLPRPAEKPSSMSNTLETDAE